MDTGNIASEFVNAFDLLGARANVADGAGDGSDLLPFIVGKGGRVKSLKTLIFIFDSFMG
jgi:hypothetical protein